MTWGDRFSDVDIRAIELTPEGRRLFDAVTRGLDEIAKCVQDLCAATDTPQITVAASVAFSYYWLMPRLERFAERCPEIDLRVLATDQKGDLTRQDADIAVLYGDGGWDGVEARRLFGERVYPVCSPALPDTDFATQFLLNVVRAG